MEGLAVLQERAESGGVRAFTRVVKTLSKRYPEAALEALARVFVTRVVPEPTPTG